MLRCGDKGSSVDRDKTLGQARIDRELAQAGWETDGEFSEHLSIGNSGNLCVLISRSTWETDQPTYELYAAGATRLLLGA